jgi:two-component system sensor histidine kinase PhcS
MEAVEKLYLESDKNLRLRRSIAGCMLSIALFPAGFSLDYFVYPNLLKFFFLVRITCSLLTLLILAAHYTKNNQKYIKLLMFSWMLLAQITICYMIFMTEKYSSTYYAGLNLTILGIGVLLPLSVSEVSLFCLATLALYLTASYQSNIENIGVLFNNVYFLVLTSVISITATYFNSRFRFKEFCLNHELRKTIDALKSTQAQLVHSEKINAIGSLSAGLLHEVNNPLNYTMTALQVMKMDPYLSSDPDMKDTVKDIEEGMTRIKNIVTDLRAFAYPEEADKKDQFPIFSAIESSLRFTASECQDIQRIVDVDQNLMVSASKTHIVQVLINLISNATKAINKSDRKTDHSGIITVSAKSENDRVIISVSDNGTGMSEETLKKVFDPFFTTNEVGQGMGLGLSVSHTIIKNHGGNLAATGELGKGSTFYFDLPC